MPFLFKDYTDCVLKTCEEMRKTGRLSRLLMHPTTGSIKQACLNVYNQRFREGKPIEENILQDFFGVPPAGKSFDYVIGKYDLDKFRPFKSFIKGEIKNPALATVELLAWLIDYNPRPLAYAQKIFAVNYDSSKAADLVTHTNQPAELDIPLQAKPNETETIVTGSKEPSESSGENFRANPAGIKLKIAAAVCLTLAIVFGGIYMPQQQGPDKMSLGITNTGCMYWAVDHYEPAPCNDKGKGLLVPLDEQKMKYFRKITRKDTITEWSIGKLYYIKNNHDIECYTEGGNYPEEPTRTLRVLSQYMFDKYLRKNKPPATDSLNLKDEKAMTKN